MKKRMMRERRALTFVFAFIFSSGWIFSQQRPVEPDPAVKISPVQHIERKTVVNLSAISEDWWPEMRNTWTAPRPGTDVGPEIHQELKRIANEIAENPDVYLNGSEPSLKTMGPEDTLSVQQSYFGNGYDGGIPNDNSVAVGKGQKVVSVANSTIRTYQGSSSAVEYQASLAGFASGQGGSASKYDPKVTYDPLRDRFIVVFLNGFVNSNSLIVVAFSQTEDPAGDWNIYTLDGSVTSNTWTDFPQIAISRKELFVTGNLFTDGGQGQGSVIWQVGLNEGFAGQTLQSRFFTTPYFSLHPVRGGYQAYGTNMYFVRTVSNPIPTSKTVFVHEMTNTIDSAGVLNSPISLQSTLNYAVSPDANQKGTTLKLDGNDCRVQSSYYLNERIELAFNTSSGGDPSVYHMTIELADNIAFSLVTARHIHFDTLEVLYPGITPGGCTAANGANSSVIMFNYASANHFPGNAAVFIDTSGNIGPIKILKTGFTFMGDNGSPSPWRWGDYADAFPRTNNPGEVWIAGSVGMMSGGQNRNGTWLTKVFSPCCLGPIGIDDMYVPENPTVVAYPNPSDNLIFFSFSVERTGLYSVGIYDLNGRLIKHLLDDKLKGGTAQLKFSTENLPAGVYFVRIESEIAAPTTRKFVVAH
jgi:hypothetical protein